jgi:hypothetical protein
VITPSWTMRLSERVLGLDFTAFFSPKADQGGLVITQYDRGVRASYAVAAAKAGSCVYLGTHGFLTNDVIFRRRGDSDTEWY